METQRRQGMQNRTTQYRRKSPALAWKVRVLLMACLGFWAGCGCGLKEHGFGGGRLLVEVEVAEEANLNSAVAVDVVLFYDAALAEAVQKMTAPVWFAEREQLRKDYPGRSGFMLWQWEWVPGQDVPLQRLPVEGCVQAAMVFADYLTPGEHRARFDPTRAIQLYLLKEEFVVSPLP